MCSTTSPCVRSSSARRRRVSSSFELRITVLTNSAIRRVVSTASSSNAFGLLADHRQDARRPRRRGRAARRSASGRRAARHASRSTRGSVGRVRGVDVSPRAGGDAREARVPVEAQADVRRGDAGARGCRRSRRPSNHCTAAPSAPARRCARSTIVAVTASGSSSSAEISCCVCDDRVQAAEARCAGAPRCVCACVTSRSDVCTRPSSRTRARVLDVDHRCRPCGGTLARREARDARAAPAARRGWSSSSSGRGESRRVHVAELLDSSTRGGGGGVVRVEQVAVEVADERRVGRLGVQLAVAPLASREPLDELGVAKRDRRRARKQADRVRPRARRTRRRRRCAHRGCRASRRRTRSARARSRPRPASGSAATSGPVVARSTVTSPRRRHSIPSVSSIGIELPARARVGAAATPRSRRRRRRSSRATRRRHAGSSHQAVDDAVHDGVRPRPRARRLRAGVRRVLLAMRASSLT